MNPYLPISETSMPSASPSTSSTTAPSVENATAIAQDAAANHAVASAEANSAQKSATAVGDDASFTSLLNRPAERSNTAKADFIHGIVLGYIIEFQADGQVALSVPSFGIERLLARPVCAVQSLQIGAMAALMFEQGDTSRALLLGPMALPNVATIDKRIENPTEASLPNLHVPAQQQEEEHAAPAHAQTALVNQQRIVIEADQELELRCGAASILLTADGRILSRGSYISSHATATQRVRGASVQIN